MTDKQLVNKAIDIKGKKYVLVSDRVLYFNEAYPNGSIITQRIMTDEPWIEIFKATVTPDTEQPNRCFTWYSQARWWEGYINKAAALENAETSAVGRALAFMWIWVIDSIASMDEINKATNTPTSTTNRKPKFTLDDFNRFKEKKAWEFSNYQEAKAYIEQYFTLGKDLYWKVMDLYGSSEDESQELMF